MADYNLSLNLDLNSLPTEQILGLPFLNGSVAEAVDYATRSGGLVVAPSGTCFDRLQKDAEYREAVSTADLVLPDSGLFVSLCRLLRRINLTRISGLAYLKHLIGNDAFRAARTCWVLPHEAAREKLLAWAGVAGLPITAADCYVAPIYSSHVQDDALVAMLRDRAARHVIIAIGAGAQEKLGWYLREHLGRALTIHCIGGALGFLTGDQVAIPGWADRLYLGWFFRLLANPRVFIPRLWNARVLPALLIRETRAGK